jgi:hypothetical protein
MSAFVIYNTETGAIQGAFRVNHASDLNALIAANTPAGASSLIVDHDNPAVVDQRGWKVSDGALVAVVPTAAELLAAAQTAQAAEIEASYQNATFQTPIDYMAATFWTDQNSQSLLMGAVVGYGMAGGTPDGFLWWSATNTGVPMTLADLQGLYQAIMVRINDNFVKRKALLASVTAATTVTEVQAVVWS